MIWVLVHQRSMLFAMSESPVRAVHLTDSLIRRQLHQKILGNKKLH
jgi:hypothetical protein